MVENQVEDGKLENSDHDLANTVGGESYVWEKFHEFSQSHKAFSPVHFKSHWNQQCIVGIVKLFHRYAK